MYRKILILFVGMISLGYGSNGWKAYEEAALMISHQSPLVEKLFVIAQKDKNITAKHSTFDNAVRRNADKMSYSTLYDYAIDDKSEPSTVVSVVFMIIMEGLGYMRIEAWESLSNEEEILFSVNRLLKKNKSKLLSKNEEEEIHQKMMYYFKGNYDIKKQIDATNKMIEMIEMFVKKRALQLLWFQNNSDSYGMFIVEPKIYKALHNKVLDDSRRFSIPYFTMEDI